MNREPSGPPRPSFYRRLGREQRREYDLSDARRSVTLVSAPALGEAANEVMAALAAASPSAARRAAQRLVDEICERLGRQVRGRAAKTPTVKVLRSRPRRAGSELHGLYARFKNGESQIVIWMRTAAQKKVVRPRTFLRTLLHEVCHHIDMTMLRFPHSLHTIGFHARESSLLRTLERSGAMVPNGRRSALPRPERKTLGAAAKRAPTQLELFTPRSARSSTASRGGRAD